MQRTYTTLQSKPHWEGRGPGGKDSRQTMKTKVNLPFALSFRRVSFSPIAWKKAMVSSKLSTRSMECKNTNSPSAKDQQWGGWGWGWGWEGDEKKEQKRRVLLIHFAFVVNTGSNLPFGSEL